MEFRSSFSSPVPTTTSGAGEQFPKRGSVQHFLKPSRESLRKKSLERQGLTLNKLAFADGVLYGRDEEITIIRDVINNKNTNKTAPLSSTATVKTTRTRTTPKMKIRKAAGDTPCGEEEDQQRPTQVIFVHGRSGTGKSKVIQKALRGLNQKSSGLYNHRQQNQPQSNQRQDVEATQDQDKESANDRGVNNRGHCERCSKHYVAQGKFDLRNVNRPYTALSDALSAMWASIIADHRSIREEAERREIESNGQESDDAGANNKETADDSQNGCGSHDAFHRVRQALGSSGPPVLETLIPNISRDLAYETLLDESVSDLGLHDNSSHHRRSYNSNNNIRAASHSTVPFEDAATATKSTDNEQTTDPRTTGGSGTPERRANSRSKSLGAFLIGGGGSVQDGSSVGRSGNGPGSVNSGTSLGINTSVNRHKLELYFLSFIHAICGNVARNEKNPTTATSRGGSTECLAAVPTATVALFLDDLQWADNASLGLLESLLYKGTGSNNLVLICSYRDDEIGLDDQSKEFIKRDSDHIDHSLHGVDKSHPLVRLQNRMKQKAREALCNKQKLAVDATYIKIGNLSLCHVQKLVSDALRMDSAALPPRMISPVLRH